MTPNTRIKLKHNTYSILHALQAGGQAEVFCVERECDKKHFALKLSKISNDPYSATRLNKLSFDKVKKEAQFLNQLQHNDKHYIVPCLDEGDYQHNEHLRAAFVMPLYEDNLSDTLDQSPPSLERRIKWIKHVTQALKHIHQQHQADGTVLIHRDLKLANLMLTANDDIRLVDFGLSKATNLNDEGSITRMHYSPEGLAPEQILITEENTDGKESYALGTHVDMYALGLLIYYMILERMPSSQEDMVRNVKMYENKHKRLLREGEETGLLGELGGLTPEELNSFKQRFIHLASHPLTTTHQPDLAPQADSLSTGTLIDFSMEEPDTQPAEILNTNNPAITNAANAATDLLAELMHKHYQQRISAKHAYFQLEYIDQQLQLAIEQPITPPPNKKNTPQNKSQPNQQKPPKAAQPKTETNTLPNAIHNPTPSRLKQWLPWSLASLLLGVVVIQQLPDSMKPALPSSSQNINSQAVIDKLGTAIAPTTESLIDDLVQGDNPAQDKAWHALQALRGQNDNANQALNDHEKKTNQWIQGDNPAQQKAAIKQLERSAQAGSTRALLLLADAYEKGRGTEPHWGQAWQYYQLAIEQSRIDPDFKQEDGSDIFERINVAQAQLETQAANVLLSNTSSTAQRSMAYDLIEARANTIPSGDSAHLWLAYRYKKGDGVPPDAELAQQWQNRYDGQ